MCRRKALIACTNKHNDAITYDVTIRKRHTKVAFTIQGVHKVRVHFRVINFLKCTRTLWTPCISVLQQVQSHSKF